MEINNAGNWVCGYTCLALIKALIALEMLPLKYVICFFQLNKLVSGITPSSFDIINYLALDYHIITGLQMYPSPLNIM